jgi:hypothetical protein
VEWELGEVDSERGEGLDGIMERVGGGMKIRGGRVYGS